MGFLSILIKQEGYQSIRVSPLIPGLGGAAAGHEHGRTAWVQGHLKYGQDIRCAPHTSQHPAAAGGKERCRTKEEQE